MQVGDEGTGESGCDIIGIIREEYVRHENRKREATHAMPVEVNQAFRSVANRRGGPATSAMSSFPCAAWQMTTRQSADKFCKNCKKSNHKTKDCHHLGKP